MQNNYIITLLAIGLVLAQLALAQHAIDLGSHADEEPCEICLLSTGLDQVPGQESASAGLQPVQDLTGRWQRNLNPAPLTTAFLARAPPPAVLTI